MIKLRNLESIIEGELLFRIPKLDFLPAKSYLIVGENGSGKTSLLKSLIGQFDFITGDIQVEGKIIYQPQNVYLYQKTPRSNFKLLGLDVDDLQADLKRLDIDMILDRSVDVLSGGQRQKVAFIRSLHVADQILILDEPFSQMDAESTEISLAMMAEWHQAKENRTLVVVTHDAIPQDIFDYKLAFENQSVEITEL